MLEPVPPFEAPRESTFVPSESRFAHLANQRTLVARLATYETVSDQLAALNPETDEVERSRLMTAKTAAAKEVLLQEEVGQIHDTARIFLRGSEPSRCLVAQMLATALRRELLRREETTAYFWTLLNDPSPVVATATEGAVTRYLEYEQKRRRISDEVTARRLARWEEALYRFKPGPGPQGANHRAV